LVGISTSLATIEISIDFTHTKQNKKKPTVWPYNITPGDVYEGM
jgi:hypothetical protein